MESILSERHGAVLVVRFNRPAAANALDAAASLAVDALLCAAETDGDIGAVVLTGAGDCVLCSGMDLKQAAAIGVAHGLVAGRGFCGLIERLYPKPVIAAVNGAAVAGGLELALACDMMVASDTATFGQPEIKRGLVAYTGGVPRLARQLPRSLALEIILTGAAVPAERLYAAGVVSQIVPRAEGVDAAVPSGAQPPMRNLPDRGVRP